MLIKEAGYSLRDIRGTRTRRVRHEEPTDLFSRFQRWCPYLADPEPRVVVETAETPGMMEEEVMRRLVYHDEIETIKEEESEKEMQNVRRQNGAAGPKKRGAVPGGGRSW